jgi:MFS family permease
VVIFSEVLPKTIALLSGGAFGGIYMTATLASALTLPWLGRTLDLMPGWRVVRFTMPALAFACILIAVAPNIAVLAVAIYLLRLFGQGMMTETALVETGRWFVANRGRAMALVVIGLQAGAAVLPMAVVLIGVVSGDWRTPPRARLDHFFERTRSAWGWRCSGGVLVFPFGTGRCHGHHASRPPGSG